MKKSALAILILLLISLSPTGVLAADYLAEADKLYDAGGVENYKKCIDLCLKAVQQNQNSFEANWKCARAHRQYGDEVKKLSMGDWEKACATYGKAGMNYAQKAIEIDPGRPEGYYYYGLSVGIYSDGVSILTALKEGLKNKTQDSFEKVYEIDKMYDEGNGILALGRFWAVLPWPLNDKKKALEYYREYQNTSYFASNDEAHIYIAELLMQKRKTKKEAKALLDIAAKSEDKYFSDWANRLLSDL